MLKNKLRNNWLAVVGFGLPYLVIISIALGVTLLPYETTEEKWEVAGGIVFYLPFATSLFCAILVGINTVKRDIELKTGRNKLNGFLFSLICVSAFHFFATIYIFMLGVYSYAGMKH